MLGVILAWLTVYLFVGSIATTLALYFGAFEEEEDDSVLLFSTALWPISWIVVALYLISSKIPREISKKLKGRK